MSECHHSCNKQNLDPFPAHHSSIESKNLCWEKEVFSTSKYLSQDPEVVHLLF